MYEDISDKNLLILYQNGDEKAFEVLYLRHKGCPMGCLRRGYSFTYTDSNTHERKNGFCLVPEEYHESICQQVWMEIIRVIKNGVDENYVFGLDLYQRLRWRAIEHCRSKYNHDISIDKDDNEDGSTTNTVVPATVDPDDDLYRDFFKCFERLDENEKVAYHLKLNDKSLKDICKLTNTECRVIRIVEESKDKKPSELEERDQKILDMHRRDMDSREICRITKVQCNTIVRRLNAAKETIQRCMEIYRPIDQPE